jgi:AhpD family alkylhydroperoxidase
MEPRLNLSASPLAAKAMKYFVSANKVITENSTLPRSTQELVMLRASQINGCGWCSDVHTKELAHAGETPVRINLVAAWRESAVFTDAELAALELTEQGTRMADAAGVTDQAWGCAAEHYDEEQLAALVLLIGLINASTRMGVITRLQGGGYQPGQFA